MFTRILQAAIDVKPHPSGARQCRTRVIVASKSRALNIIGSQCFQLKIRGIHLCAHGDLDPVLVSRSQPGTCISVSFSLLIGIDHPCIYFNTSERPTEDTKRRIYYFGVLCYGSFCTNRRIKRSGLTAIRQAPVNPPAPSGAMRGFPYRSRIYRCTMWGWRRRRTSSNYRDRRG